MATRNDLGGGVFIALGSVVGVAAGASTGEPTPGLIAGFAVGTLIAVLLYVRDAARR